MLILMLNFTLKLSSASTLLPKKRFWRHCQYISQETLERTWKVVTAEYDNVHDATVVAARDYGMRLLRSAINHLTYTYLSAHALLKAGRYGF
jgi:hypothetical protein